MSENRPTRDDTEKASQRLKRKFSRRVISTKKKPQPVSMKQVKATKYPKDEDGYTPLQWSKRQDWTALRREFVTTTDAGGGYYYRNAWMFASHKCPQQGAHLMWMRWSIGRQPVDIIPWQGSWDAERLIEESKYSVIASILRDKVNQEIDSIKAGHVLAGTYLPYQERLFTLYQELIETTGHRVLVLPPPNATAEEKETIERKNEQRWRTFYRMFKQILSMKITVDSQFMRMLGGDQHSVLTYMRRVGEIETKAGTEGMMRSRVEELMVELAKNQIEKAEMYELDLPDDLISVQDRIAKMEKNQ